MDVFILFDSSHWLRSVFFLGSVAVVAVSFKPVSSGCRLIFNFISFDLIAIILDALTADVSSMPSHCSELIDPIRSSFATIDIYHQVSWPSGPNNWFTSLPFWFGTSTCPPFKFLSQELAYSMEQKLNGHDMSIFASINR